MDQNVIYSAIISLIISLILLIIEYILKNKPKLTYSILNKASFMIKNPKGEDKKPVFTASLLLNNTGSSPVKNVRIHHLFLTPNIFIFPPEIESSTEINSDIEGSGQIILPVIPPKKEVLISYLFTNLVHLDAFDPRITHDDGKVYEIKIVPQRQYPKLLYYLSGTFVFMGLGLFIYIILSYIN